MAPLALCRGLPDRIPGLEESLGALEEVTSPHPGPSCSLAEPIAPQHCVWEMAPQALHQGPAQEGPHGTTCQGSQLPGPCPCWKPLSGPHASAQCVPKAVHCLVLQSSFGGEVTGGGASLQNMLPLLRPGDSKDPFFPL